MADNINRDSGDAMNIIFRIALPALALLCAACSPVRVTPFEGHDVKPDDSFGLVSGIFSRKKSSDVAFVVRNATTGSEYILSFGEDTRMPQDITNEMVAIRVPPGRYAVTEWVTFATITKDKLTRKAVTNPYVFKEFDVGAGTVVFLGKYAVEGSSGMSNAFTSYLAWEIHPLPITSEEARQRFVQTYPAFVESAFSCLVCADTVNRPKRVDPTYGLPAHSPKAFGG